jgi:hypothetical protein
MPCSTVEVDRRFRVSRQEVTDKSYIKRDIYVFHYLRSIAIRMRTILTVALAWYVYEMMHLFLARSIQNSKFANNVCVCVYIFLSG